MIRPTLICMRPPIQNLVMPLSSLSTLSSLPAPTPVSVPVPWGSVEGLKWHLPNTNSEHKTSPPVPWLALHGLMDNLGTFNRLLPGLPGGIEVTCIDLPGHGLSSHLAPGSHYHWLDTVLTLHRVKEHLGLEQPVLLGHSMGGWMAQLYAAVFPQQVRAVISLDGVKPVSRFPETMVPRLRDYYKGSGAMEKGGGRPSKVMTKEEALERLFTGTNKLHGEGAVTIEAAQCLLERGLVAEAGGHVFGRDKRLALRDMMGMPHIFNQEFARNIKCPHLLVLASQENAATSWGAGSEKAAMKDIVNIYKDNPLFSLTEVEGSHHVHLNNPEKVLPHILRFVESHQLDTTRSSG